MIPDNLGLFSLEIKGRSCHIVYPDYMNTNQVMKSRTRFTHICNTVYKSQRDRKLDEDPRSSKDTSNFKVYVEACDNVRGGKGPERMELKGAFSSRRSSQKCQIHIVF